MTGAILRLPANTTGHDIVVADFHGKLDCLSPIIKKFHLGKGDRLFIAGDMLDRGPDSLAIIETIIHSDVDVRAVRGNHEDMAILSIKALEFLARELSKENKAVTEQNLDEKIQQLLQQDLPQEEKILIDNLQIHLCKENGGRWLLKLFADEFKQEKISVAENIITYTADSKILMLETFINNLPWIISVDGKDEIIPFNIVHADMPINDDELARRIKQGKGLTSAEIYYATCTRPGNYDPNIGRTFLSNVTYCGHQVIGFILGDCLRKETNTVDLDRGACFFNISLVVDHKTRQAFVVVSENYTHEELQSEVSKANADACVIQNYLNDNYYLYHFRNKISAIIYKSVEGEQKDLLNFITRELAQLNEEIKNNFAAINLQPLSDFDLLRLACLDLSIPDDTMLRFMRSIIKAITVDSKDELLRNEDVDKFVRDLNLLANLFNLIRKPKELLCLDGLTETLKPESISVAKCGVFAIDNADGVSVKKALKTSIKNIISKFFQDHETAYCRVEGKINLQNLINEIIELIASINQMIHNYNEKYPHHMPMKSCETFYSEQAYEGKYKDLILSEENFVICSLRIEDLKHELQIELAKCLNEEERIKKIKQCHQEINSEINKYNIANKDQTLSIEEISLNDLLELTEVSSALIVTPAIGI